MNPLAALLLLTIVIVHFGYDPICALLPNLANAAGAVFYVLRGIEGSILFTVIAWLRPTLWPICLWGFIEEGETAACRLMAGPLDRPPVAAAWSGLCGEVSHFPWYMFGIVTAAVLVTRKNKP